MFAIYINLIVWIYFYYLYLFCKYIYPDSLIKMSNNSRQTKDYIPMEKNIFGFKKYADYRRKTK